MQHVHCQILIASSLGLYRVLNLAVPVQLPLEYKAPFTLIYAVVDYIEIDMYTAKFLWMAV